MKIPFGIAPLSILMGLLMLPLDRPAAAQEPTALPTEKIVLDTDIGDDIDDAYALALILNLPNAKLLGVTTTFGETQKRAELAAKFLHVCGRDDVPVYAGRAGTSQIRRQYEWAQGFRSPSLKSGDAALFLKNTLDKNPGQVTLVGIGALTNIGDLLTRFPEVKPKIKRIVITNYFSDELSSAIAALCDEFKKPLTIKTVGKLDGINRGRVATTQNKEAIWSIGHAATKQLSLMEASIA